MVRTEELLAGAARLNHLQQTRPDLLNGRHVGRKDTKVTGHGGHVHLSHLNVVVERLESERRFISPTWWGTTKLSLSLSLTASA